MAKGVSKELEREIRNILDKFVGFPLATEGYPRRTDSESEREATEYLIDKCVGLASKVAIPRSLLRQDGGVLMQPKKLLRQEQRRGESSAARASPQATPSSRRLTAGSGRNA